MERMRTIEEEKVGEGGIGRPTKILAVATGGSRGPRRAGGGHRKATEASRASCAPLKRLKIDIERGGGGRERWWRGRRRAARWSPDGKNGPL